MSRLNLKSEDLKWLLNHLFIQMHFKFGAQKSNFDSIWMIQKYLNLFRSMKTSSPYGELVYIFEGIFKRTKSHF